MNGCGNERRSVKTSSRSRRDHQSPWVYRWNWPGFVDWFGAIEFRTQDRLDIFIHSGYRCVQLDETVSVGPVFVIQKSARRASSLAAQVPLSRTRVDRISGGGCFELARDLYLLFVLDFAPLREQNFQDDLAAAVMVSPPLWHSGGKNKRVLPDSYSFKKSTRYCCTDSHQH